MGWRGVFSGDLKRGGESCTVWFWRDSWAAGRGGNVDVVTGVGGRAAPPRRRAPPTCPNAGVWRRASCPSRPALVSTTPRRSCSVERRSLRPVLKDLPRERLEGAPRLECRVGRHPERLLYECPPRFLPHARPHLRIAAHVRQHLRVLPRRGQLPAAAAAAVVRVDQHRLLRLPRRLTRFAIHAQVKT